MLVDSSLLPPSWEKDTLALMTLASSVETKIENS